MTATQSVATSSRAIGRAIRRKEDPRLITGRGFYVDDVVLPGMLHVAIVRSTEAHADIVSIDVEEALGRESVRDVVVGEELELAQPLPMIWHPPGAEIREPEHW